MLKNGIKRADLTRTTANNTFIRKTLTKMLCMIIGGGNVGVDAWEGNLNGNKSAHAT